MARTAVLAILAAVAAACSGSGAPATTDTAPATTVVAPVDTGPVDLAAMPGRLVVIADDGNLVTMRADGSDEVALTEGAGARLTFSQPTWSPDGSRVAWTEVDGREGEAVAALVTSLPDGSARTRAATDLPVFYTYWDPAGARLAYLHAGSPALEMGIVDVAGGGDAARTVDSGQPYYFAWSPDGAEMLVHVGTTRLERLDPAGGGGEEIGGEPGAFQAPSWNSDGSLLYAAGPPGGRQRLVRQDAGGNSRDVLAFEGFIWFLPAPDGDRVAFQVLAGATPDAATASFAQGGGVPDAPPGALGVVDLATGAVSTLTVESSVGFFWSPTGTLLSLHPDGERSGWFRWRVWGDEPFTGPSYRPSATLARDYLPFFDQYARSITLWSPDGRAFVYAGRHDDGGAGIWVQSVDGAEPVRVTGGSFAAWSWK